ncbi:AQG_2a_G0039320.mRNA.1.CDS.1 [Saccharomyces cerevisiae]|nr:Tda5p [Saccharomyces cerevisiae YJM993]AJP40552.1 Tda5p [Saccharomyces cerevisiae YJM1078]AJV47809.1 Tda5p [Saccharomyces cerevisiae YJM1190]AJV49627.1 Tda5p [Saccharomyces cerevisiae YJM1242]AJV50944.1 Tda5p [Saccharomyces cerevisiae YJM1250]AJV51390.1 Tda5p [Saccharomyces cerevisiae YJM1252]AJV52284.1 Tda5p [Saccharomyces cerevisiae YJM1304]AJV53176.1 Tda5p [Saccharomyces cerevisiae YJM1311]AJV53628.1 Tda5p [Saccharomyces cerevisiae YJM1326]AJV54082.1 Tda5p [Saccharomyces cerevisiae Y
MNIDCLCRWVVLPLLRYPLLVALVLRWSLSDSISICLTIYTLLINAFLIANSYTKRSGQVAWKSLREFKNGIVLITGGSKGLGRAIVSQLLQDYSNLTILNVDICPSSVRNTRVKDLICDLSDDEEVAALLNLLKRKYKNEIRLIVNNAGVRANFTGFSGMERDNLDKIFKINTFAPLQFIQELAPSRHSTRQCYIVNIASILGILTPAKVAAYAASKAALIAFHQSYSFELQNEGVRNIRTLLVTPGQLNTEMFAGFKPPRQFFAPVIDITTLAAKIVRYCELGQRGQLNEPFYCSFAHLLMCVPYSLQRIVRSFSRIDCCLPDE